jgi:hypothetical protein
VAPNVSGEPEIIGPYKEDRSGVSVPPFRTIGYR